MRRGDQVSGVSTSGNGFNPYLYLSTTSPCNRNLYTLQETPNDHWVRRRRSPTPCMFGVRTSSK